MGPLGCSRAVHSFPRYSRMGWTVGIGVVWMGLLGMFPRCPILPTVHWDGMDSGDRGSVDGTAWDVPTLSNPSHGTLGRDGKLG